MKDNIIYYKNIFIWVYDIYKQKKNENPKVNSQSFVDIYINSYEDTFF